MVEKRLTKKVTGGKLFNIDIKCDETIEDIKITGDFFLHPEDFILKMEASLIGIKTNSTAEQILKIMNDKIEDLTFELIGVTFEDIVNAIVELINNKK